MEAFQEFLMEGGLGTRMFFTAIPILIYAAFRYAKYKKAQIDQRNDKTRRGPRIS